MAGKTCFGQDVLGQVATGFFMMESADVGVAAAEVEELTTLWVS